MRIIALLATLASAVPATAATVDFTLPVENTTPSVFGSLPWPNDLYFDQGRPGDGDGTLLNVGASIGLGVDVIRTNTASVEDGLGEMQGFGTSSAIYFFLDGPISAGSLPASPDLAPSLTDSVFCADAATATPVPILLRFDVDSRIHNVLGVLPLPGRPLRPKTTYTCVVRTSVAAASADWLSVRDGASANGDADAIYDPVVATLASAGVSTTDIGGMTVFTTEPTTDDLARIRDVVLPGQPTPTADLTSRPELVFNTPTRLQALLGTAPSTLAAIATGFYGSPRFQTLDPNGNGPLSDLPLPPSFITCLGGVGDCETTDERFTHDGSGNPVIISVPQIPFTVAIPSGTPPPGGWPIIIQQHGLGGQRDTVVAFAQQDAARGFASIGIDAVAHGYRFFDCGPSAVCSQDTHNNVGGTAVPDGFVDGTFAGQSVSFLTVNLGFFQAFHNFLGIRDNFRQTYADLLSLVRLIQGHSIDAALGTTLNDGQIYYMGHSLGGLMGSGFVPIETNLKAALLNATGGGLSTQLFLNSSIGAGAQALVNGILGLDPANVADQFNLSSNLTQSILDPADAVNSAGLLLSPDAGAPRNVIQIEDFGDQVVPNQANEAAALAAGLPIFDPYVQNLHQSPLSLAIANPGTPRMVHGNAAGGMATAVLLQNGPATHASSLGTTPGTVTFVPEFAHIDDFIATGNGFTPLVRGIRIANVGVLDDVLSWFADIVANGTPGTFTTNAAYDFNPAENHDVPAGASSYTFLARTVDAGGMIPISEPTPDVTASFAGVVVPARFTVGRSILGTTPSASDADLAPGPFVTLGTPGVLPFFVTIQHNVPGPFTAGASVAYTTAELLAAGIPPGSASESALGVGRFVSGACAVGGATCAENGDCGANGPCNGATYSVGAPAVDATNHVAGGTFTQDGVYAVLNPNVLTGGAVIPAAPGGGSARTDCGLEFEVVNPLNTPFIHHGVVNAIQTCQDGDPLCDADLLVNNACAFRVAVCLNQTDASLPTCTPTAISAVHARKSRRQAEVASTNALLGALASVGGTLAGNDVTFSPALAASQCTAFTTIVVNAGTHQQLRFRATSPTGTRDGDRLRLVCSPG